VRRGQHCVRGPVEGARELAVDALGVDAPRAMRVVVGIGRRDRAQVLRAVEPRPASSSLP
jgi:hypothetical protein